MSRGKVGAVSAEWPLALPERLDRTRSEGGPAKKAGSNVKAVQKRCTAAVARLCCQYRDGQNGNPGVVTEGVERANLWRAEGGLLLQLPLLVPLQQQRPDQPLARGPVGKHSHHPRSLLQRLHQPLQQPHLRHASGGAGSGDAGSGIDAGSVPILSGELAGVILTSLKGTETRLREDMKQLSERVAWVEHSQAGRAAGRIARGHHRAGHRQLDPSIRPYLLSGYSE